MHWGIRRYQNPDGSLTNRGRKQQLKFKKKEAKWSKKHAKYEKKAYKAMKRDNADKLLKYQKKSAKASKKMAKFHKKAYKFDKHVNKNLKKISKQTKTNGRTKVEMTISKSKAA